MIPRLFVDQPLSDGAALALSTDQSHYLRNVLRRDVSDEIRVFNETAGEFSAQIEASGKKGVVARVGGQTRAPVPEPELVLAFAPVKRAAVEMIMQKATELGVSSFRPVVTARTNSPKLNIARLQAIAVEAAEQCGRLSVPSVCEAISLEKFIGADARGEVFFCDEAGDDPAQEWGGESGRARSILKVATSQLGGQPGRPDSDAARTILIGPEGGFTAEERAQLRAAPRVTPVGLGPRILRADTAAIAALTIFQAVLGDWRQADK